MSGVCIHTQWSNKLAPKSKDMIFIGYEPGTKGYGFRSWPRRTIVISSTAIFDEFDFPNCPREKLLIKRIQIKEEMMVYNLLIMINQIIYHH